MFMSAPDLCGCPTLRAFPATSTQSPGFTLSAVARLTQGGVLSTALSGWDRKSALPLPTEACFKRGNGISEFGSWMESDFVL